MEGTTQHILEVVTQVRGAASEQLVAQGKAGTEMGKSVTVAARQAATSVQGIGKASVDASKEHEKHSNAFHISAGKIGKATRNVATGFLYMGDVGKGAMGVLTQTIGGTAAALASGSMLAAGLALTTGLFKLFGKEARHSAEEFEKFKESVKEGLTTAKSQAEESAKALAVFRAELAAKVAGGDSGEAGRRAAYEIDRAATLAELEQKKGVLLEKTKYLYEEIDDAAEDIYVKAAMVNPEFREQAARLQEMNDALQAGKITLQEFVTQLGELRKSSPGFTALLIDEEELLEMTSVATTALEQIAELEKAAADSRALETLRRKSMTEDLAAKERAAAEEKLATQERSNLAAQAENALVAKRASLTSAELEDLQFEETLQREIIELQRQGVNASFIRERIDVRRLERLAREREANETIRRTFGEQVDARIRSLSLTSDEAVRFREQEEISRVLVELGREKADELARALATNREMVETEERKKEEALEYYKIQQDIESSLKAQQNANVDILTQISRLRAEIEGGAAGLKSWERDEQARLLINEGVKTEFIEQLFALQDQRDALKDLTELQEGLKDATKETTKEREKQDRDKGRRGREDGEERPRRRGKVFGVTFDGGTASDLFRADVSRGSRQRQQPMPEAEEAATKAKETAGEGQAADAATAAKIKEATSEIGALLEQLKKSEGVSEEFQKKVQSVVQDFKVVVTDASQRTATRINDLEKQVQDLKKMLDNASRGVGGKAGK